MSFRNTPILILIFLCFSIRLYAQPEFTTWGNMTGIRNEGQLMEFETSICIVSEEWSRIRKTEREQQTIRFAREGNKKIFSYEMDSLTAVKSIESAGRGEATVNIQFISRADTSLSGAFFRMDLPIKYYKDGTAKAPGQDEVLLNALKPTKPHDYLLIETDQLVFTSPDRQLDVRLNEHTRVIIKRDKKEGETIQVYIQGLPGKMTKGLMAAKSIHIKATGTVDDSPVKVTVNTAEQGRPFDGIGGNFRLQNPKTDPPVIDYSLKNLRVAWSRVEVPWRFWQPEEDVDPIDAAKSGKLHEKVKSAMEMAQRLDQLGIPVILAVWSGPDWAIEGQMNYSRQANGTFGNSLNQQKKEKIYRSIADYVLYLKENYGVEAVMFSFNESDLGINIRQTPEEHALLIKELGAYFALKGLKTQLLLGDTADVNGWPFIEVAMADKNTHPYLGAVSFHSWRGYTDENLERWKEAAEKMDLPLIVGEGSIDAGAWRYPAIFEEPTYALEEIDLYTRILNICEPLSILQWQLTADYSAMSGGGVVGNDKEPLHPTQRFWNLKQLGSTPQGLFALPVYADKTDISCAALGDRKRGVYAVHLVNTGATREVALTGLPKNIKKLKMYNTDSKRGMEENESIAVSEGNATFILESATFTSLITDH